MWDYICPKCRKEVEKNSHKCVHCSEQYGIPVRVPPQILKDPKLLEDYIHRHIFPRVSKAQRDYLTQYFTDLFTDGQVGSTMETAGDLSAWTSSVTSAGSSVLSVSTDDAHHGGNSCKHLIDAFTDDIYVLKTIGSQTVLFFRNYIKITSWIGYLSTRYHLIMNAYQGGNHIASVGIGGTTRFLKLFYRDGAVLHIANSSTVLDLNTWYCIELEVDQVEQAYRVFLNSIEVADLTQTLTVCNWTPDRISVGQQSYGTGNTANTEAIIYTDCVVVADARIYCEAAGVSIPVAMHHLGMMGTGPIGTGEADGSIP